VLIAVPGVRGVDPEARLEFDGDPEINANLPDGIPEVFEGVGGIAAGRRRLRTKVLVTCEVNCEAGWPNDGLLLRLTVRDGVRRVAH